MAPFDRSHTSCNWRSVVTIVISYILFEKKRDIGRKSRFSPYPSIRRDDAPVRDSGFLVGILPQGSEKPERWLLDGEKV